MLKAFHIEMLMDAIVQQGYQLDICLPVFAP